MAVLMQLLFALVLAVAQAKQHGHHTHGMSHFLRDADNLEDHADQMRQSLEEEEGKDAAPEPKKEVEDELPKQAKKPEPKQDFWTQKRYSDRPWMGLEEWKKMDKDGSMPKRPPFAIQVVLDEVEGIKRQVTCSQRNTGYIDCVGGLLMNTEMSHPAIQTFYRQFMNARVDQWKDGVLYINGPGQLFWPPMNETTYGAWAKEKLLSLNVKDIKRECFPTFMPDFMWIEEDRKTPVELASEYIEHGIADFKAGYLTKREMNLLMPWERTETYVGEQYTLLASSKIQDVHYFNILANLWTLMSFKHGQYFLNLAKSAKGLVPKANAADAQNTQNLIAKPALLKTPVGAASAVPAVPKTAASFIDATSNEKDTKPASALSLVAKPAAPAKPFSSEIDFSKTPPAPIAGAMLQPFWWPKDVIGQYKFMMGMVNTFFLNPRKLVMTKGLVSLTICLIVNVLNNVQRAHIGEAIKAHLDYVVARLDDNAQAIWRYAMLIAFIDGPPKGGKALLKMGSDPLLVKQVSYAGFEPDFKPLKSPEDVNEVVLTNKLASLRVPISADMVVVRRMQATMWGTLDKKQLAQSTQDEWVDVNLMSWFAKASSDGENVVPQELFTMFRDQGGDGIFHFKAVPFGWVAFKGFARKRGFKVEVDDDGNPTLPKKLVLPYFEKQIRNSIDVFDPEIRPSIDNIHEPDYNVAVTMLGYAKWDRNMRDTTFKWLGQLSGDKSKLCAEDLKEIMLDPVKKAVEKEIKGDKMKRDDVPVIFHSMNRRLIQINFNSVWRSIDADGNGKVSFKELKMWWLAVEEKLNNQVVEVEDSDPMTASAEMEEGRSMISERQDFQDAETDAKKYKGTVGKLKLHKSYSTLKLFNLVCFQATMINLPLFFLKWWGFMKGARDNFKFIRDVYTGGQGSIINYLKAWIWITKYEQMMVGLYGVRFLHLNVLPANMQWIRAQVKADIAGVETTIAAAELDELKDQKAEGAISLSDYAEKFQDLQKKINKMNKETAIQNKRGLALKLARTNMSAIGYTMGYYGRTLGGRALMLSIMKTHVDETTTTYKCPEAAAAAMNKHHILYAKVVIYHVGVVKTLADYMVLFNSWRLQDRLVTKKKAMDEVSLLKETMKEESPEVFKVLNAKLQAQISESDERAFMRFYDAMTFKLYSLDLATALMWFGWWNWQLGIGNKAWGVLVAKNKKCGVAKLAGEMNLLAGETKKQVISDEEDEDDEPDDDDEDIQ